MYEHETPPAPPQNTPFPGLTLKVGKMNYCLGKMDPISAQRLKSGQNFSESGQEKLFILMIQLSFKSNVHVSLCFLCLIQNPFAVDFKPCDSSSRLF